MRIISREELKEKLDRGDDVKLIMALDSFAFKRLHIPGSLHFDNLVEARDQLDPDDEIVVYCSNPACPASVNAYYVLHTLGFKRLSRYAGGLAEWQQAGYPLEGTMAPNASGAGTGAEQQSPAKQPASEAAAAESG